MRKLLLSTIFTLLAGATSAQQYPQYSTGNGTVPATVTLCAKADGTQAAVPCPGGSASTPSLVVLQAGANTIGQIRPFAVTPAAGAAAAIVTGGVAVTLVTGPVNGCTIQNPITATDQNISVAEVAYINGVATATANGRGQNTTMNPGDIWRCVPGQTTNVSVIAATSAHAFSVEKW